MKKPNAPHFPIFVRTLTPILISILALGVGRDAVSAELVTLTPENWDEYAPAGKEVDAIYGDYAIRNDKLIVVIAQPVQGRDAHTTLHNVGAAILDLTLRDAPRDELTAFQPHGNQFTFAFADIETEDAEVYQIDDPSRLIVRASSITLHFSSIPNGENPEAELRYTIKDGWDSVLVETILSNLGTEALEVELEDLIRLDASRDGLSLQKPLEGTMDLFWLYDKWAGQAYGLVAEGGLSLQYGMREGTGRYWRPHGLSYLRGGEKLFSLKPGEAFALRRRLYAASDLFHLNAAVGAAGGREQAKVTLEVKDIDGEPVGGADVSRDVGGQTVVWGTTGADGVIEIEAPPGRFEITVSAVGRGSTTQALNPGLEAEFTAQLERAGLVTGTVRDESGRAVPCKIEFRGVDGTADPFFGPDSGERAIHNLHYAPNGTFRQAIDPGKYEVHFSHGPEYDVITNPIEVRRGYPVNLDVVLFHSVETPGWISTDFHSHASPSGDNVSSQLGRVINLLCEHIEFAPCTEHNRVSSYAEHLTALGAERLMATCSGIELTGRPGHLNHQNAFPLIRRPHTQDGGAPRGLSSDMELQIERLALWDNGSEKLIQQNHPDIAQIFFDRNADGVQDGGFSRAFGLIDVIEVHSPNALFRAPVYEVGGPNNRRQVNNRMFNWLQMLNQGHRIPGVVNTDAHANFHGSGFLRNYIKSPSDNPARVETVDMVSAAKSGNLIMTNGPYLEVNLRAEAGGDRGEGTAGDDVSAPDGQAKLYVRIQCPNWLDVDRVQIFLNGRPSEELNFTREKNPDLFTDRTIRFDQEIALDLSEDTHVIVATVGENSTLGPTVGPSHRDDLPIAIANPIYVDVDGNGFKANGDPLDERLSLSAGSLRTQP